MGCTNKEILKSANEAITKGNFEGFLIHCTENTRWNFLGDKTIEGKEAVRNWMCETYSVPPKFTVKQMIAEDDFVVAIGDITLTENGREIERSYCDVWRFENSHLAELNAYVVDN